MVSVDLEPTPGYVFCELLGQFMLLIILRFLKSGSVSMTSGSTAVYNAEENKYYDLITTNAEILTFVQPPLPTDHLSVSLRLVFGSIDEVTNGGFLSAHCINDKLTLMLVFLHLVTTSLVLRRASAATVLKHWISKWITIVWRMATLLCWEIVVLLTVPRPHPHHLCHGTPESYDQEKYTDSCFSSDCADGGLSPQLGLNTLILFSIYKTCARTDAPRDQVLWLLFVLLLGAISSFATTIMILTNSHWSDGCVLAVLAMACMDTEPMDPAETKQVVSDASLKQETLARRGGVTKTGETRTAEAGTETQRPRPRKACESPWCRQHSMQSLEPPELTCYVPEPCAAGAVRTSTDSPHCAHFRGECVLPP